MTPFSHFSYSTFPPLIAEMRSSYRKVFFLLRSNGRKIYTIPPEDLVDAFRRFTEYDESHNEPYCATIKTLNGYEYVIRRILGDFQGAVSVQVQDQFDKSVWHELCTLDKPLSVFDESHNEITYLIVRPECYWQPRANQVAAMKNFISPECGFRDITGPTKVSTGGRGYFVFKVIPGDRQGELVMLMQDRSVRHIWHEFEHVSSIFFYHRIYKLL